MAEVTVNTLASNQAGVAVVKVVTRGYSVETTGTSKKHPKDQALVGVGEELALARALKAAAEDLERHALQTSHYWNG